MGSFHKGVHHEDISLFRPRIVSNKTKSQINLNQKNIFLFNFKCVTFFFLFLRTLLISANYFNVFTDGAVFFVHCTDAVSLFKPLLDYNTM